MSSAEDTPESETPFYQSRAARTMPELVKRGLARLNDPLEHLLDHLGSRDQQDQ